MKKNTIIQINSLLSFVFIFLSFSVSGQNEIELKTAIGDYKRSFYQAGCKSALLETQIMQIEKLDYTAVTKCQVCKGKGVVIGEQSCQKCNGTGREDCRQCYGEGSKGCSSCNRSGKIYCSCAYETLSDALLKLYHYNVNCSICGGSAGGRGQLNCQTCSGKGSIPCTYCDGTGKRPCTNCRDGVLMVSICCDDCKGLGRLVE